MKKKDNENDKLKAFGTYLDRIPTDIVEDFERLRKDFSSRTIYERVEKFFSQFFKGGHEEWAMSDFSYTIQKIVWTVFAFFSEEIKDEEFINVFFISPFRKPHEEAEYEFIEKVLHPLTFGRNGLYEYLRGKLLPLFDLFLAPSKLNPLWFPKQVCLYRKKENKKFISRGSFLTEIDLSCVFDEEEIMFLRNYLSYLWLKERKKVTEEMREVLENYLNEIFKNKRQAYKKLESAFMELSFILEKPYLSTQDNVKRFGLTLLLLWIHDPFWKYYYYLPGCIIPGKSIGAIVLGTEKRLNLETIKIWHNTVSNFITSFVIVEHERKILKHALKATAAMIMARNMSHTLGSQILMRCKNIDKKNWEKVLDYVISRSEFIADVTSGLPIHFGKGYFLLEENRESGGKSESGFVKVWVQNHPIKEKLVEASGGKIKQSFLKVDDKLKNTEIALPFGSEVGTHAFHSIIENYIRNISKYAHLEDNTLTVELEELMKEDESRLVVKLTSNAKLVDKETELRNVIDSLKKGIDEPMIDKLTGEPAASAWGLKEMKICATLLVGEKIENLIEPDFHKDYFYIMEEDMKKNRPSYKLTFLKYLPFHEFQSLSELNGQKRRVVSDFIVIKGVEGRDIIEKLKGETLKSLPIKTALIVNEDVDDWVRNNFLIFTDEDWRNKESMDKERKRKLLMERFLKEKILRHRKCAFKEINGVTLCKNGSKKIRLGHWSDSNIVKERKSKKAIGYSGGQPVTLMWKRKLGSRNETDRFEWQILVESKILLIDNRIYDVHMTIGEAAKKEMELLGIKILPEEDTKILKENNKIIVKNENERFNEEIEKYNFVSVHYGYLEQTEKNNLLLKEENIQGLKCFLFTHTGRGRIGGYFKEKYWWFRRIFSVKNLISSVDTNLGLFAKINLLWNNILGG